MLDLDRILEKDTQLAQTGRFTSDEPVILGDEVTGAFEEHAERHGNVDDPYGERSDMQLFGILTNMQRSMTAHANSAAATALLHCEMFDYPMLRHGILQSEYWNRRWVPDAIDPKEYRTGPHLDDFMAKPRLQFWFITGQPMLYYPGTFTLDPDEIRAMGIQLDATTRGFLENRKSNRELGYRYREIDDAMDIQENLFSRQIEVQGIEAAEAPVDQLFVTDHLFMHAENQHGDAAGSFRGFFSRVYLVHLLGPHGRDVQIN